MSDQYYREAMKLGQKEYRACVAKGISPVLPVLDDFVADERVNLGIKLGTVSIPVEFIVGTKTRGRTNSFARNFMPVLSETSEFAGKWIALCESHLRDGIRDPIKVYEYMNRYYVQEGNKRVSVLKFFGAVSIQAEVTRVLPERGTGIETDIYYEYVEFYKYTKVNFLEFSKRGGYKELLKLLGRDPEAYWTEEERRKFSTVYHYFREAFEDRAGKTMPPSAVGDALLAYMKVYSFDDLSEQGPTELRKSVSRLWEELMLQQEKEPIELKPAPMEPKGGLLSKVIINTNAVRGLKVGFVHDKDPVTSGWTYGHEQGRQHVDRRFGDRIETVSYFNAMDEGPQETINQAVKELCDVIFTTSPVLLPASLRTAVENPDKLIMNCSINKSHRYVRTYYARMYEAKFIIGAVAGALAENGRIGYVCDYPIFGQIAGINAFALGARMVNPRARVQLEWSSVGGRSAAMSRLTKNGITLISSMDNARLYEPGQALGLSYINGDTKKLIAAPIWNWGVYYEGLLRQVFNGTLQAEYESSSKAINYYWGMSAGAVDVMLTDEVPESTRRLAGYMRAGISRWIVDPFIGPIHIQGGSTVGEAGKPLEMEEIAAMDYLVENVEGRIPVYEELSPTGKATVESVGVESAKKPEKEAGGEA